MTREHIVFSGQLYLQRLFVRNVLLKKKQKTRMNQNFTQRLNGYLKMEAEQMTDGVSFFGLGRTKVHKKEGRRRDELKDW